VHHKIHRGGLFRKMDTAFLRSSLHAECSGRSLCHRYDIRTLYPCRSRCERADFCREDDPLISRTRKKREHLFLELKVTKRPTSKKRMKNLCMTMSCSTQANLRLESGEVNNSWCMLADSILANASLSLPWMRHPNALSRQKEEGWQQLRLRVPQIWETGSLRRVGRKTG